MCLNDQMFRPNAFIPLICSFQSLNVLYAIEFYGPDSHFLNGIMKKEMLDRMLLSLGKQVDEGISNYVILFHRFKTVIRGSDPECMNTEKQNKDSS